MKRISAIILALLLCLSIPVITYADDIYIVEDEEEVFVPETTTAAPPQETTTKKSSGLDSIFGGGNSIGGYLDGIAGVIGGGMDSIISGFENEFGNFQFGTETTTSGGLQPIAPGNEAPTVKPAVTTAPNQNNTQNINQSETTAAANGQELPSVIIVNGEKDTNDTISGGTLTLLVFIAGIVLLILVGAIVLVFMTRKTDYNSKVKNRSTIPSVAQPSALAQFMEDDSTDDDQSYDDITFWDDEE